MLGSTNLSAFVSATRLSQGSISWQWWCGHLFGPDVPHGSGDTPQRQQQGMVKVRNHPLPRVLVVPTTTAKPMDLKVGWTAMGHNHNACAELKYPDYS